MRADFAEAARRAAADEAFLVFGFALDLAGLWAFDFAAFAIAPFLVLPRSASILGQFPC
ncbi:MAG TPA: hypothetical protein VID77_06130 [Stellaceae bacterium]